MSDRIQSLNEVVDLIPAGTLPPVHEWQPTATRDIDIRISRNGDWYYQGSQIQRSRMVKLFSSVLRKDDDQQTYLVTPQERLRITVDDAPFSAVLVECYGESDDRTLVFTTNVGDQVVADKDHTIQVEYENRHAEPAPYITVRHRLRALICRPAFYQMVEWAEERDGVLGVQSAGQFMPLYYPDQP